MTVMLLLPLPLLITIRIPRFTIVVREVLMQGIRTPMVQPLLVRFPPARNVVVCNEDYDDEDEEEEEVVV